MCDGAKGKLLAGLRGWMVIGGLMGGGEKDFSIPR